jgi:hypothetical protein
MEKIKLEQDYSYLEYDTMKIDDDFILLNKLFIDQENTYALSLVDNNIKSFETIYKLFSLYPNIKAIWLNGNPFEEENEDYELKLIEQFPNLELVNRKFTPNAGKWSIEFLFNNLKKKQSEPDASKYRELYGNIISLDLSGRDPLSILNGFDIFESIPNYTQINCLDIRDNYYELWEKVDQFFNLLSKFPNLEHLYVDFDLESYFEMETEKETEEEDENNLIYLIKIVDKLLSISPKIKFINAYSVEALVKNKDSLRKYLKETWVRDNLWSIAQTYRLMTSEKYDEDATWYINDEIGSAINHSDVPNVALFPFIYSPSNKFGDDMITYSILWPLKNIQQGSEIVRDFLTNINEIKQRSARLTVWFQTPKDYFLTKFYSKMETYSKKSLEVGKEFTIFEDNIKKLGDSVGQEKSEEFKKLFKETFDLELLKNKINSDPTNQNLYEDTEARVLSSITGFEIEKNIDKYFVNFPPNEKIKVFSDLPYVRDNLKYERFEVTLDIDDADILWLNTDYFKFAENLLNHEVNNMKITLKSTIFKNQFPFENVITMKSHLTDLVQSTFGLNNFLNLSYNMETELSEIIGNYYFNESNYYDNSWILKPINMSRSMDMIVTNNLKEIIRSVETGPKICQKYIDKPLLMNNKKFDLRFIILLKNLVPLELYFYSKIFWVRTANNDFTMDRNSFTDYPTHFTVMNYNEYGLKTVFNHEFLAYLKERNIEWTPIYEGIKQSMKNIFLAASKNCPQMCDPYSRAIYGLDVMIDNENQPKVLEINYSPDCTRACKYTPEFFDDIFRTLFLNDPSGVELVN